MTKPQKILAWTFWLFVGMSGATIAIFAGITLYLSPKLPEVEALRQIKLQTPLRVYSADGALLGEFGEKRRTPVAIEDVPQHFIDAILAAEDDRFYSHPGVDIKGLLRAASQLLQSGQIQTGGSTITMQVARNFFLTRKQTFSRKFNEILLALNIEKELSKNEILELYVNKIYLGNRAYGIEAAARVYYGKSITELSLPQLAMIAGLPKAPSAYNPLANPQRALVRRNWILDRMLALGLISPTEHSAAIKEVDIAQYHGIKEELNAPYIAEMARQEAVALLGEAAYTDGYTIITTVNSKLQTSAQRAVIDGLMSYDQRHGYRGPEGRMPARSPLADWPEQIRRLGSIAGLKAAAVTRINDTSIDVILGDATQARIDWQHGLSSARRYINENSVGPAPKNAAELFKVGDIIRYQLAKDGQLQLTQIPAAQAAMVALNPDNGAIQALVGGLDFYQSHFNRITQAARQPGSNFKPFIYATALENGMTPATLINDAPIVFEDDSMDAPWRPENATGTFLGPTRLRQALYESRNLVSIRVLQSIGIGRAIKAMSRYGFDSKKLPHDLSLALGSHALPPLQIATGYAVFANGGYRVNPYLVEKISNMEGDVIFEAAPATVCRSCDKPKPQPRPAITDTSDIDALESAMAQELNTELAEEEPTPAPAAPKYPPAPRILDPQVAYLIDDMLRDVVRKGTARKALSMGRNDLAGKTGTTNGPTDAWFSGYNHHIVATAWLGFDQNSLIGRREFGGTSALPIWMSFMSAALQGVPEKSRELPEGLVSVRIDPTTGKRAVAGQSNAIFELFRREQVPAFEEQRAPNLEQGRTLDSDTLPDDLF